MGRRLRIELDTPDGLPGATTGSASYIADLIIAGCDIIDTDMIRSAEWVDPDDYQERWLDTIRLLPIPKELAQDMQLGISARPWEKDNEPVRRGPGQTPTKD